MTRTLWLFFIALAPTLSVAQHRTTLRPPSFGLPKEIKFSEKKELGWKPEVSISGQYSLSSSQSVIGQTDGDSHVYGLNFKGVYTRIQELSEWRNSLLYNGATNKTPTIPRYVKSSDELKLESIYLKSLPDSPQYGAYVKGAVVTSIFRGEDVRSGPTTYNISNSDGTLRSSQVETSLPLTHAFRPVTLQESGGMFWKPQNDEKMVFELRGGIGAMQVFAKDQLAVNDKTDTTAVEIIELRSFNQVGVEAGGLFKGKINEKSNYEFNAEVLVPVITESGEDRSTLRLTNVSLSAKLSSQITDWASFSYDYKMKLQPQLIERAQIQHMLVLNITYNLLGGGN